MIHRIRCAFLLLVTFSVMLAIASQSSLAQPDTIQTTPVDSLAVSTPVIPAPAAVTEVTGKDSPDDRGNSINLSWKLSGDDGSGAASVVRYEVFRATSAGGPFEKVGVAPPGEGRFTHQSGKAPTSANFVENGKEQFYRIDAVTSDSLVRSSSEIAGPFVASGQWFNGGRLAVFVSVLFFTLLTLYFLSRAKRGDDLYVRPLAGLEAVDEAIGRATEMGKPILYVMGLGTASDISTIASFTILSRVAKRVAEYQTDLIVPCYDPIAFTIAQEIVQSSFLDAGRPDSYKEEMVYFVTQAQFAFVAAVNGTMVRVKPATNLYLGKFYAESLMLAETGSVTGSIQIAGTDEVAQIPFFVVACDYTLIGEELYAASAYLGREPLLLGSLKAQDWAKGALIICTLIGVVAAGFEWTWFTNAFRVLN